MKAKGVCADQRGGAKKGHERFDTPDNCESEEKAGHQTAERFQRIDGADCGNGVARCAAAALEPAERRKQKARENSERERGENQTPGSIFQRKSHAGRRAGPQTPSAQYQQRGGGPERMSAEQNGCPGAQARIVRITQGQVGIGAGALLFCGERWRSRPKKYAEKPNSIK